MRRGSSANCAGVLLSELSILLAVLAITLIFSLSLLQTALEEVFLAASEATEPRIIVAMTTPLPADDWSPDSAPQADDSAPEVGAGTDDPNLNTPDSVSAAANGQGGGSDTTMIPPGTTSTEGPPLVQDSGSGPEQDDIDPDPVTEGGSGGQDAPVYF